MSIEITRPLHGVWLPLVTPFLNGELDDQSIQNLAKHYINEGVDGFILAATTGESLALDDRETRRVVDLVQEVNEGRVPVFLGKTGSYTAKLASQIEQLNSWPVDGYLIAAPYYVRPSQEGLKSHFRAVANASALPIVVYNIPYRTGVNITNEAMREIATFPNVIGVKDCCASDEQSADLIANRPTGFSVLVGDDGTFLKNVVRGAEGGILASAHLCFQDYKHILSFVAAGKIAEAEGVWGTMNDIIPLLFAEPNPAPIKYCLARMGLIRSPELRLPLTSIGDQLSNRLVQRLFM